MKVIKSELTGVTLQNIVNTLQSDAEEASQLISSLEGLAAILQTNDAVAGKIFENVASKINDYIVILQQRKATAESLKSAISDGAQSLADFMEDEPSLDTNELSGININLSTARTKLLSLESKIKEFNFLEKLTDRSNWKQINSEISYYQTEIENLEKLKYKLDNLISKDSEVFAQVASQQSSVTAYSKAVSEIQPSNIVITQEV